MKALDKDREAATRIATELIRDMKEFRRKVLDLAEVKRREWAEKGFHYMTGFGDELWADQAPELYEMEHSFVEVWSDYMTKQTQPALPDDADDGPVVEEYYRQNRAYELEARELWGSPEIQAEVSR